MTKKIWEVREKYTGCRTYAIEAGTAEEAKQKYYKGNLVHEGEFDKVLEIELYDEIEEEDYFDSNEAPDTFCEECLKFLERITDKPMDWVEDNLCKGCKTKI